MTSVPASRRREAIQAVDLDAQPIFLGEAKDGFQFRARSVDIVGAPTPEQFTGALQFAAASHEAAPYWIADMLSHAETRDEWKGLVDQILSITGLARQTVLNLLWVGQRVDVAARAVAPSLSHAMEVARLPVGERHGWLEQARTHGWTRRELRQEVRAAHRPRILNGQAALEGQYRVLLADPLWPDSPGGMSIDALCRLPIAAHAAADAVLFLRVPAHWILANPGAREVGTAWGFTAQSGICWDMVRGNDGAHVRVRHSHLTIWTRGTCLPDRPTDLPDSVQIERRDEDRPGLPQMFRRMIERHYDGPRVELFAREAAEGWATLGSDVSAWK